MATENKHLEIAKRGGEIVKRIEELKPIVEQVRSSIVELEKLEIELAGIFGAPTTKVKRGRPAGSKNKHKAAAESNGDSKDEHHEK